MKETVVDADALSAYLSEHDGLTSVTSTGPSVR